MAARSASRTGSVCRRPTVPRRVRSRAELRDFQRGMAAALLQPLTAGQELAPALRDGRDTTAFASTFIKPNPRLTAFERLQIYARCYWFRITDSVYEDCPGLRALLGERRFAALVEAFLGACPSRSFTLRNLCRPLPAFILAHPRWTAPDTALAHAVARFEWAQTHAFDAGELPPISIEAIAAVPPHQLRLGLQPHLSLLAFDWPIDRYVLAVKRRDAQRAEASNTAGGAARTARLTRVRRPRRRRTHIVVHRYRNRLFYRRESPAAFAILESLAAGRSLSQAIAAAGPAVSADRVRTWFATWTELGWLVERKLPRNPPGRIS